MTWIIAVLLIVVVWWAIARFYLAGENLSRFDAPTTRPVNEAPSAENRRVLEIVDSLIRRVSGASSRSRLKLIRESMDQLGEDADLSGVEVRAVTVAGRPAEWVVPADREPRGRLLYLHGGGYTAGSPLSHRSITAELARRTRLALLVVDYRLMPEHSRAAGIEDCRNAYRWIVENGPDGPAPAEALFVAGDSAGGNLTLMLIAWIRDQTGLRQVDGAIALSPATDATMSSPSLNRNMDSDPLLGPLARLILRFPYSLRLWSTWVQNRLPPPDPQISPVRGDLSRLPPVLVQASESEILIDDARRYVNKARAAGSPAELETWQGMVHVWQAFGPELPETEQAFTRMQQFVERVLERRGRANAA